MYTEISLFHYFYSEKWHKIKTKGLLKTNKFKYLRSFHIKLCRQLVINIEIYFKQQESKSYKQFNLLRL